MQRGFKRAASLPNGSVTRHRSARRRSVTIRSVPQRKPALLPAIRCLSAPTIMVDVSALAPPPCPDGQPFWCPALAPTQRLRR